MVGKESGETMSTPPNPSNLLNISQPTGSAQPVDDDFKSEKRRDKAIRFVTERVDDLKSNLNVYHKLLRKCESLYMGMPTPQPLQHLPSTGGMLIHRHCNVASAKIEQAIINSGALLSYVADDQNCVESAQRVTRFMEKHVKELPGNMRHLRHTIAAIPKLGTPFMCVEAQYDNLPPNLSVDSEHPVTDFGGQHVRWRYVSPDKMLIDPEIITLEDQPVVIEKRRMTRSDILYMWKSGQWDAEETAKALKGSADIRDGRKLEILANNPIFEYKTKSDETYDVTIAWFPDGYKYTIIGEAYLVEARQTVHNRKNGGCPYVPFHYVLDAGGFFSVPLVWQLMPIQKEINDSKSLGLFAKMSALCPPLMVQVAALRNEEQVGMFSPGKIVHVERDPREIAMEMSVPAGNFQAAQASIMELHQEAEYIDGITENLMGTVSGGRTPTGTERIRNANAHSQIDAIVNQNIDSIVKLGELSLLIQREIVQRFGVEEFLRTESGDYYYVMGDDFDAALHVKAGVDINRIEPQKAIANLQAWLGAAMQSIQMGAPFDPSLVERSVMYMGELMGLPVEYLAGNRKALQEAMADLDKIMRSGYSPNVDQSSDHLTHIVVELPYMDTGLTTIQRQALGDHLARHAFELQTRAIQMKQIKAPVFPSPEMMADAFMSGDTGALESALGVSFAPGNQGNTLMQAAGALPEMIPQSVGMGGQPMPPNVLDFQGIPPEAAQVGM
jgi:hypothetical protein